MSNHPRRARRNPALKVAGTSGTILTLGAALVAVTPGTAGAASIQVTSAADDNGTGLTLREAVVQANGTAAEDDVITFAPALNGQTITLDGTLGEIDITDDLVIQGPGAGLLTVAGSGDAGDRIFYIGDTDIDITVSGLTLTDGHASQSGGAIYSFTKGAVTLTNLHVTGNYADGEGGGVAIWSPGTATITGSTFDHNEAVENGGGLHVYNAAGAVTITSNTFDHNYSDSYGGGVSLYQNAGATTITGSTFTDNEATIGGGLSVYDNEGTVSISGSTLAENTATYGGGISIYNSDGQTTISTSTIADNVVNEFGGGVRIKNSADVTIGRSTISGNYASVDGGGIYAYDVDLTVINSTISGNEAGSDGGGIAFAYAETENAGSLVIAHSTITDNTANEGGGLYLGTEGAIDHTIIAGNTGGDVDGDSEDGHASLSNSLIGGPDLGQLPFTDDGNNEFDADPMLGPLANNGGPTLTHALLEGSPALDSGDPAFAAPPATDQRGEDRVAFDVIDKGAYELQPEEPPATGPGGAVPVPTAPTFTG